MRKKKYQPNNQAQGKHNQRENHESMLESGQYHAPYKKIKVSKSPHFWNTQRMKLVPRNFKNHQTEAAPVLGESQLIEPIEFRPQFLQEEQNESSSLIKMTALMKVLYRTETYRKLTIFIHMLYMFGVLIELPEQICQQKDSQKFRCQLSYYIQVACLATIVPFWLVKKLRLVGVDYFRLCIEVVVFVCGILSLAGPEAILRYVKALRCLRLLLIVRQTNLIVPAYNMLASLRSIKNVLCPAILFIYIYAIIGLYSFSDNQYSRCRNPNVLNLKSNWTVYDEAMYLCGEKACPFDDGVQYECLNPIEFGVEPSAEEFRHLEFGSGLLQYSNIFNAFLITYKQTLITGSSRVILLQKQATNFVFVLIYYYSFIYLLSYIYLNIFYGLMIVNRQKHISTKEEYEALTERGETLVETKTELELIRYYERLFRMIKKNISVFPTKITQTNKKTLLYTTRPVLSQQSLILSKRSGFNLDQDTIKQAAVEHQATKEIMKIVQFKNNNDDSSGDSRETCLSRIGSCLKSAYYYFNLTVIVLGCINVCSEHAQQSAEWEKTMNLLDLVFFVLYFVDFFGRYFLLVSSMDQSQGNLIVKIPSHIYMNGIILSVCMTGYLYEILISGDFEDFYMAQTKLQKFFRALLYLRILSILSFEPFFAESRKLFQFAWQAVKKSANFMLLWLLVLIMFSLMGYFLFQNCDQSKGCYKASDEEASYNGIFEAIITTAVIMYNQDWDYIMYEHFPKHGYFIVVWNMIIITFGLLIISKYFMTYLLSELDTSINSNFDRENQEKVQHKSFLENLLKEVIDDDKTVESQEFIQKGQDMSKNLVFSPKKKASKEPQTSQFLFQQNKPSERRVNFTLNSGSITPLNESGSEVKLSMKKKKIGLKRSRDRKIIHNTMTVSSKIEQNQNPFMKQVIGEDNIIQPIGLQKILKTKELKQIPNPYNKEPQVENQPQTRKSYASFYPKSKPYIIVKSIANVVVIFNFVTYLPQYDPNLTIKKVSYYSAMVVDCLFIIDMIGQVYAYGLVRFFRKATVSRWIDIVLNVISIVYFTPLGSNYIAKRLYSLRCLRISYWISLRCELSESMRVTVKGFIQLVPKILKLLFVICIIYGFFANIIVRIYKDEMWECVNYEGSQTIVTKIDCFNYGGDWVEESLNASNFGNALLYIFLISSTEDWLNTMNYLSTVKGKDLQPQETDSSFLRISFLIFMFFANIIVINIFVGVSINNFKQIKKKVTGQTDLSKDEKEWLNIKNQIYLLEPQPMDQEPASEFRKFFFKITKSKLIIVFKFIQLSGLLILLSFVTTNMSPQNRKKIIIGQYVFTLFGFVNFVIDMIATGIKNHNRTIRIFQFILYVYAMVYGIVLILIDLPNSVQKICGGILITLQLGRYFLFIQEFQFFQKMFNSLMTILPKTKDIFLLMILTLFIYTSIGMEIFGYLKPGQELNNFDQNYVDFGSALFSLIKFSTWQEPIQQIRDGIQQMTPNSVCFEVNDYSNYMKYGQNGCGNTGMALTFFLTFHIFYSLILMPTLMGIIFDSYNEVYIDESACINKFQLRKVKQEWKKFDPEGTGYISYRDFWVLTSQIIKIYHFAHNKLLNNETRQNFLKELNISIYESPQGILCFEFHELIEALTRIILIRKEKSQKKREIFNQNKNYIHEVNKKSEILHTLKKSSYDSSHVLTLILLKSGLKSWRNKANDKNKGSLFQSIEMKNKKKIGNKQDEKIE